MSRFTVVAATLAAALFTASPALAQAAGTVTATGTGQARVHPKNRHNNASIAAAYDRARRAAIGGAFSEAHEYAADYAQAAGLTLGGITAVSDAQNNGVFYGPGPAFFGPFGPGKFCGTERRPIFQGGPPNRKVVGFKKVHTCIVPRFAYVTLTVTYSAS
jgi:uncharacterized protein YggE